MGYGMSYGRYQGDPFLGGLLKGAVSFVKGGIKSVIGGAQAPAATRVVPISPQGTPMPGGTVQRVPGITGAMQRLVPGGATGYQVVTRKRRRMNVTNDKALRRAIRRQQGFVKLARKALQGTGFQVVSRGARRAKRDMGPGHVHIR